MWMFVCLSRKANPLLDEVESWNLADLQRDRPNKWDKSETENFAQKGPEWGLENALFKLYGWIYKGYHISIKLLLRVLQGAKHDS
jgi:hypothetical protein